VNGLAFLIFLFDTLLGTLIFVAIAGLIKALAEREEIIAKEAPGLEPVLAQPSESRA